VDTSYKYVLKFSPVAKIIRTVIFMFRILILPDSMVRTNIGGVQDDPDSHNCNDIHWWFIERCTICYTREAEVFAQFAIPNMLYYLSPGTFMEWMEWKSKMTDKFVTILKHSSNFKRLKFSK
jgi:hypothetical protein